MPPCLSEIRRNLGPHPFPTQRKARKLPPKSSSSHASTGCNRSPGDAASRSTGSGAEGRGTVQEGDAGDVGELGELDDLGEPCLSWDSFGRNGVSRSLDFFTDMSEILLEE